MEKILGFQIVNCKINIISAEILEHIKVQKQERNSVGLKWLACFNPHSYSESLNDTLFFEALHNADWLVPDGIGIVYASKLLGGEIECRITGFDIFNSVLAGLNKEISSSIFLLGSTEENLIDLKKNIMINYPNIKKINYYSPQFLESYSEDYLNSIVEIINNASPDVLWVGLTAPKQEKLIYGVSNRIKVHFAAGIGAVFDFYTNKKSRAPVMFQRTGFEWLYRLCIEPKRIWKRTLISMPIFLLHLIINFKKK